MRAVLLYYFNQVRYNLYTTRLDEIKTIRVVGTENVFGIGYAYIPSTAHVGSGFQNI